MIVHSTVNIDAGCLVQVEGIEPGQHETVVRIFAEGAAGKHNPGYEIRASSPAQWLDEHRTPIAEGSDTTHATSARVLCSVVQPSDSPAADLARQSQHYAGVDGGYRVAAAPSEEEWL